MRVSHRLYSYYLYIVEGVGTSWLTSVTSEGVTESLAPSDTVASRGYTLRFCEFDIASNQVS